MFFRTVLRLQSRAISCASVVSHRAPLSTSIVRLAKKDEAVISKCFLLTLATEEPNEETGYRCIPLKYSNNIKTKPYAAEYTQSGRNEDVNQKDTSYDPSATGPKQQKKQITKEEVKVIISPRC